MSVIDPRMASGIATVVLALIVVTPLCGLLFDCGCTWPWAGLADHCNIHDKDAIHRCPWCASPIAGTLSVGLSIVAAYVTAASRRFPIRASVSVSLQRTAAGLLAFLGIAVLSGWISATVQGYPYFIL
jgi:hypothetical protein